MKFNISYKNLSVAHLNRFKTVYYAGRDINLLCKSCQYIVSSENNKVSKNTVRFQKST